jgi:hypothetical protein
MAQNRSNAVMATRVEPPDSLDLFPTPCWATRALVEHVLIGGGWRRDQLADMTCWEPASGLGHMVRPLREYFRTVHASDVHDYSDFWDGQERVCDFLFPGSEPPHIARHGVDFVISNPPFKAAAEFILRGRDIARVGVAMLVRTSFIEGGERYRTLFSKHPPAILAPFAERVPMFKGRVDPKGSTATAYSWLVWSKQPHHAGQTVVRWIQPCRKQLTREGDYA